jgi:hypothetical protein
MQFSTIWILTTERSFYILPIHEQRRNLSREATRLLRRQQRVAAVLYYYVFIGLKIKIARGGIDRTA